MDAYQQFAERQAQRELRPLRDFSNRVEHRGFDAQRRMELARTFGNWIARKLSPWDWFLNPISFRDRHPDLERNSRTGRPRSYRTVGRYGRVALYVSDPRLKAWQPQSKHRVEPGPPVTHKALAEIMDFFSELQEAAGPPIRVMLAEEFGRIGGRYHCHALVHGAAHLPLDEWWEKAFERFGRTRIELFDPDRAAAFYCAKYAAKEIGGLYFIGPSPGAGFSAVLKPGPRVGGVDVVSSPELSRDAYRHSFENLRGSRWNRRKR